MHGGALPGFRDFYPDDLARRAHIFRAWREVARRYAFVEYDGPPLEPLDLYTRKSGEEIVTQLYNFEDKGGRALSLRPEMTPTFARMVAARANALRKPVRWFSVPQLFRYERAQKGRLREHYQLNVDIVGEPGELADAELMGVALDIVRELGLGPDDVKARVSDRRLLNAVLAHLGVAESQVPAVYEVVDKLARTPRAVSAEKLASAGLAEPVATAVLGLGALTFETLAERFGAVPTVQEHVARLARYRGHLEAMGLGAFVVLDLTIVRGLAYYTGIVFELFDAQGEFRAVAGGGRYDNLLRDLGGVDLPALGFGMGDVVLGELLAARGKLDGLAAPAPEVWLVAEERVPPDTVLAVGRRLREAGCSVEYAIGEHSMNKQRKASHSAGSGHVLFLGGAPEHEGLVTYKRHRAPSKVPGLPESGEHLMSLDDVVGAFARMHGRE